MERRTDRKPFTYTGKMERNLEPHYEIIDGKRYKVIPLGKDFKVGTELWETEPQTDFYKELMKRNPSRKDR